jgi:hypothetical protein
MAAAAEQWAQVRTLLGEALELDPPDQLRFVDAIEDPVLRAEVQACLTWIPAGDAGGNENDPLEHQPWVR